MGLLGRLGRVIRANINNLLQEAEDPEKILEDAVLEMQQNLITMRQAVAQAIANQKRVERQMKQNQIASQQWQHRAQLALTKGDEELAREALLRRSPYEKTVQALQSQIAQQKQLIDKLREDLGVLENKIIEVKTKKDLYLARARTAVASQKVHELAAGLKTGNTSAAFEKIEQKLLELEAHSEILNLTATDPLEQQFKALEKGAEFSSLARSLNAVAHSSVIDEELETLRSQLDHLDHES
jgi:phage shock protein A